MPTDAKATLTIIRPEVPDIENSNDVTMTQTRTFTVFFSSHAIFSVSLQR